MHLLRYCFIAILLLPSGFATYGQIVGDTVIVSVGKQSIRLPTPSGYVNAWENYPNLRSAFEINETENNQMLAIFAPLSSIPALDSGKYLGFPHYTKVSVSKSLATLDISETQFTQFVDLFEKKIGSEFKTSGPDTKKVVTEIKRDLRKHLGTNASFELKDSVYLGPISRTKHTFLSAAILAVGGIGKNIAVYNVTALVLVRSRILFVYFYANIQSGTDLDMFNAEAKKIVDALLVTNPAR